MRCLLIAGLQGLVDFLLCFSNVLAGLCRLSKGFPVDPTETSSYGRRNGDQYPHVRLSADAVWLGDVGGQHVAGSSRYCDIILAEKDARSFKHCDG